MSRMKSKSPLVNVIHRLLSELEILQDTNFRDNGGTPQETPTGEWGDTTPHGTGTVTSTCDW